MVVVDKVAKKQRRWLSTQTGRAGGYHVMPQGPCAERLDSHSIPNLTLRHVALVDALCTRALVCAPTTSELDDYPSSTSPRR